LLDVRKPGIVEPQRNEAALLVQWVRNLDLLEWCVFYTSTIPIWPVFKQLSGGLI
jgi:hypothetical protein